MRRAATVGLAIDLWIEGRKVLAGLGKCRYHQISWMAFCTNPSIIKHLVQTVDQEVGGSNPSSCTNKIKSLDGVRDRANRVVSVLCPHSSASPYQGD